MMIITIAEKKNPFFKKMIDDNVSCIHGHLFPFKVVYHRNNNIRKEIRHGYYSLQRSVTNVPYFLIILIEKNRNKIFAPKFDALLPCGKYKILRKVSNSQPTPQSVVSMDKEDDSFMAKVEFQFV